eukprot:COSAG06_NODE_32917_length_498_cov_0.769424_1_plen_57_part_10
MCKFTSNFIYFFKSRNKYLARAAGRAGSLKDIYWYLLGTAGRRVPGVRSHRVLNLVY